MRPLWSFLDRESRGKELSRPGFARNNTLDDEQTPVDSDFYYSENTNWPVSRFYFSYSPKFLNCLLPQNAYLSAFF